MNYVKLFSFIFLFPYVVISQDDDRQISFRDLSVDDGLSQNSVVSIAQDSIGYMWFATQDGLNKYDGKEFTFFNKQFEDVTRPTYSKLGKIYVDGTGIIWIITNSGKLEKFNEPSNQFKSIKSINNASCILQRKNKDYYIGTFANGLFKIDRNTKDTLHLFKDTFKQLFIFDLLESKSSLYVATSKDLFEIRNNAISKLDIENNPHGISALASSANQEIWAGTFGNGLYYKTNPNERFVEYQNDRLPKDLNIQDLLLDKNQNLWIATYGDGVYLIEIEAGNVKHFVSNKNDPYALHYDDVLSLYEDYTGAIWLGTDGAGLSYYDEFLKKFNIITNDQIPKDVHVDVVRAITVDSQNTMWLGTSGNGLTSVNSELNSYRTYTVQNSKLSSDRIMSLLSSDNELWIGHQGRGLQIRDAFGQFHSYPELEQQTIWKIYKDKNNQIWLCTRDLGLLQFSKEKGIIKAYNSDHAGLTSNNIRTIEEGSSNDLWIGTEDNGLFVLNTASEGIKKIDKVPDKIKSLYLNKDRLWIGTNGNGLKEYSIKDRTLNTYNITDGLSNNVIYGILPDNTGDLWLSSNKGITRFSLKEGSAPVVENYSSYSGLQAFEFNTGAYYKDQNGQLYFGGLKGVNWFDPGGLSLNTAKPRTVISKFEIFGNEQPLIKDKAYSHNQNTMTFTFAGLHFSQPERNLYRYKLVNHDADWTYSKHTNVAHYTNLPPNTYTFMVLSSNYDGIWNNEPITYSFEILKPWYATDIAKTIYILGILSFIFAVYRYMKFRWEVQTQLRLEHAETERLKKLDEFKTNLYTNISHEFRTPLSLISGPIDHQLSKKELDPLDREELNLVKQNANRLLNLVNQMVDLSLLDSGQLRLNVAQGNLRILLKQIVAAFQYKADEKGIQIRSVINDLEQVWFDRDILEKITSNLMSNAIKYAPKESEIIFDANQQNDSLVLSIINTHNSLTQKDFGKLFQRFYQDDSNSEGVGVGLALVKELVSLSKGSIIANNIDTDKLQFTVTLPIHKEAFQSSELKLIESDEAIIDHKTSKINKQIDLPVLLVIEDNSEIRKFIISIFDESYKVIQAKNGKSGINKALKYIPDLIISDIMMPIKDGIALCNELKQNELTSHIPIILLTAKVGEENEIKGLRTGADAYITKPFSSEKLKLRVEKLIENRIQLQKHFSKDFNINPAMAISSTETEFLNRLKSVMNKHITDSEFSSEQFADAMLISRTQLHRKLKAIVGMSSSEFIRNQRLKLALPLLKNSDATVAEIAYQIGFNTSSYFIKCFKETYGCTPNDYV